MSAWDDMPPLVDRPGDGPGPWPGGFKIPPPPGAHYENRGANNTFPGVAQAQANHAWPPPTTTPIWGSPPSPSPWGTGVPYAPQGTWSPYSHLPYHPTPGAWGEFSPASRGLPMHGAQELTPGQPITATPWFNGNKHAELPADRDAAAGPEKWGSHSPPMYSQDPIPGVEFVFGGGAGFPLGRARSKSRPRNMSRSRSRSRSMGRVARQMIGNDFGWYYTHPSGPEEYNSENLARRPKDWRPDYRRMIGPIPRLPKARSDVDEFKDPIKRKINETLAYNPSEHCIDYDLRFLPYFDVLSFPHLGRPFNQIDFMQLATNPPTDKMRLFHPLLPWYIDVEQTYDNGVTVQDVIIHIFEQLQWQICSRHYYNKELGSEIRERIARAFAMRTQGSVEERKKGIKRVDYLEEKVIFVGLVRVRDGLWEMKTVA
ncbi:hypothetical protein C0995_002012 [Termitomyces sp. Mi166|nr:hypothetical protein C0995_002012 [Termitomyces sp. Mi166\